MSNSCMYYRRTGSSRSYWIYRSIRYSRCGYCYEIL
uniref:Uncharacterized protein n=1 Tax=virus sp. ctrcb4 TaxID=2825824 RepID=A0A8S5RPK2_9VIRU|nr:MAG TPA: hypothetical protein [virus sp. ctrcb4]